MRGRRLSCAQVGEVLAGENSAPSPIRAARIAPRLVLEIEMQHRLHLVAM
jgi:hypothetical protein